MKNVKFEFDRIRCDLLSYLFKTRKVKELPNPTARKNSNFSPKNFSSETPKLSPKSKLLVISSKKFTRNVLQRVWSFLCIGCYLCAK